MKKYKILVVEDDVTTQTLLQQCLSSHHDLAMAGTLERAKDSLAHYKPDLILLDIHLPDGNGFDFFNYLKEQTMSPKVPVIFLSLESDIQIKIKSFSAGAYDYITKPFNSSELVARVDAHYARYLEASAALYAPEAFDDLIFNREAQQIYRLDSQGNKLVVALSPLEFKLFQCFISHIGKTLSREQIAKEVWNKTHFQSRTIDRHISSLRKKLGSTGSHLKTISHGGYLLSLENEERA